MTTVPLLLHPQPPHLSCSSSIPAVAPVIIDEGGGSRCTYWRRRPVLGVR